MKILKSWLSDYADIKISNQELIDKIISSGTEVEGVFGDLDDKIVVAEIKSIGKHPNADRLSKVIVNDGEKDIQIVCGAKNIEVGQKVPLAKPGAKLCDTEISEATIRGIASSGMLCSDRELGVGDDHTGIKILPPDAPLGTEISQILENDIVLDIKPTPNRGDCFSHLGIAREVAATLGQKTLVPKSDLSKDNDKALPTIEILDKDLCPRYAARVVKGVKVGPSPKKIADRLIACGVKPINNIVDITNYIMLDIGQPMHAFDADKIKGGHIMVRRAKNGESILCLDNAKRNLSPNNLVIADFEKPIAIAGIIGGIESGISENTKDIIFEAAEFDSKSIRKSSKELSISTDASYRFERGVDSSKLTLALDKACALLADEVDIGKTVYCGDQAVSLNIEINHNGIREILGSDLSDDKINQILQNLGFEIDGNKCQVPPFRHDIVDFRCLSEEVGRIYGYNNLTDIELTKLSVFPKRGTYYKKEYIKDRLVDLGFTEVYNYSFLSAKDLTDLKIDRDDLLEITNPVQPENKYMRNSLIPGLIKSIAKNPTFDPIMIFEIGAIFGKDYEISKTGIAVSGKNAKNIVSKAKDVLIQIAGISADVIDVREFSRDQVTGFKIKKPFTYVFEIDTDTLTKGLKASERDLDLRIIDKTINYRPVSKYPAVTRDLAFIIDSKITSGEVASEIYKLSNLIGRVELFDEFVSEKFGADKKNLAFHIYLQSQERTLIDNEAEDTIKNIIKHIENKFNASLRS